MQREDRPNAEYGTATRLGTAALISMGLLLAGYGGNDDRASLPVDVISTSQAVSSTVAGPNTSCTLVTNDLHDYYVCSTARTWQAARDRCRNVAGFDLVRIDNAAENTFVKGKVTQS